MVSIRIPEISVFCIPRGGCGVYATTSQLLQVGVSSRTLCIRIGKISSGLLTFQGRGSIASSVFSKSVAPDGVLRIRICTLEKAANRLMGEDCSEGPLEILPINVCPEIQASRCMTRQ